MRLTPGSLLYHTFHRPKSWLLDRRATAASQRGEIAMRSVAADQKPVSLPDITLTGAACRFLTGARFYHQTIFCARSLEWACNGHVRLEIFGDGTLSEEYCRLIKNALPHAVIYSEAEVLVRINDLLPVSRFPHLRAMREAHPLMRKLLDMRAGLPGPALSLDSDMLFFRPPVLMRNWLRQPRGEFFMHQRLDALICERTDLMQRLGCSLLPGVNAGVLAIHDDAFDWPLLEDIADRFAPAGRSHLWAEQSLFAFILSRRGAERLPPSDYTLCHGREDLGEPLPALRHYVNNAKAYYTAREWRLWQKISSRPASHT